MSEEKLRELILLDKHRREAEESNRKREKSCIRPRKRSWQYKNVRGE